MIKEENLYLLIKEMYVVCEEASIDYKDAAEVVDNWPKLRKKALKALKSYRETMK